LADTTDTTTQDNPGDLRNQRDKLQKERDELAARLSALEQDEQIREAGLGHLSKRQRRTILRELAEDGTDFSADAAKDVAKELGYALESTPPPPPPGDSTTPPTPPANGNGSTEDEGDEMTAWALIDQARRESASNRVGTDFETEMRKADSPEELRDLIRTKGPRHKMIHEWDVP